jgi:hypothetical protein
MDLSNLHWGSPVGLGLFFAGAGVFFWGLFSGLAAMARAKNEALEDEGNDD